VTIRQGRAVTGRNVAQAGRVLLIAPRSDLENADVEQQRIINALHPEVLIGEVTTSDVLDAVQSSHYDVVWFLGHSGPNGIQLSDGVLSSAHFTQILRQSPPSLVVLNSCSSLYIANQVHDELQCAVICTVLDVPDLDAYITGALLAGALAQGKDIAAAYAASRPSCTRQYMLLNGRVRLNGDTEIDDVHRLIIRTSSEIQARLTGLEDEQARVRAELASQGDRYHVRLTRPHALSWSAGFVLFMAATGIIEFREWLGISLPAAMGFSLFVTLVAFWLLVWGLQFRLGR
jgi:hypothetical protein